MRWMLVLSPSSADRAGRSQAHQVWVPSASPYICEASLSFMRHPSLLKLSLHTLQASANTVGAFYCLKKRGRSPTPLVSRRRMNHHPNTPTPLATRQPNGTLRHSNRNRDNKPSRTVGNRANQNRITHNRRPALSEKGPMQLARRTTSLPLLGEIELPTKGYLFPGKFRGCITRQAADYALRQACDLLGFRGYSTHSFRRTALTRLSNAGTPLRVIQKISGHASLAELQKYLEVTDDQTEAAIANI